MTDDSQLLSGRTAVVTGSSSGIGRAIAVDLGAHGANVIVHGRTDSSRLEETRALLESQGTKTTKLWADLADETDLSALVDTAWNWQNRVDIWINNAGADVLTGTTANKEFTEKLDWLWKVDVRATLLLSRLIGAKMRGWMAPSKGVFSILNIGWDQAWQGMEGDSGEIFATTKGAIMSMTKSLAQSLAPEVRVNCLAPGWIKTTWAESASADWQQRAVSESLMNRWGTPADVANAATFLSSDKASFISGQIIPINGGFRYRQ